MTGHLGTWVDASTLLEAQRFGIAVECGDVPMGLVPDPPRPRWLQVTDEEVLVRLPQHWRLLVSRGSEVVIQAPEDADMAADMSWVVDTWGIPLALMQRGLLSLHASTVNVHGQTLALAGSSGAGKSTTAWGLHQRGHRILVDESTLCEVTPTAVLLHPYRRRVHLTLRAAEHFGLGGDLTRPVTKSGSKVSVASQAAEISTMPLDRVVVLNASSSVSTIKVETLAGPGAIPALAQLTERRGLAPRILGGRRYLDLLAGMVENADIVLLTRPSEGWCLDEVLDTVEALAR